MKAPLRPGAVIRLSSGATRTVVEVQGPTAFFRSTHEETGWWASGFMPVADVRLIRNGPKPERTRRDSSVPRPSEPAHLSKAEGEP